MSLLLQVEVNDGKLIDVFTNYFARPQGTLRVQADYVSQSDLINFQLYSINLYLFNMRHFYHLHMI